VARPAVIVALPPSESIPVATELLTAGFEVMEVEDPGELEQALAAIESLPQDAAETTGLLEQSFTRGLELGVPAVSEEALRRAAKLLDEVGGQNPDAPLVSTLALEKEINTFFRLHSPSVIARLREAFPDLSEAPDPQTVFLKLRELRNTW